jgi:hypothetical protein
VSLGQVAEHGMVDETVKGKFYEAESKGNFFPAFVCPCRIFSSDCPDDDFFRAALYASGAAGLQA